MRARLETLIREWMISNEKVIFLAADIGGGLFKNLKKEFPERVLNVGIAEQNMIGMAAGLSCQGFRVICYSKACFISLRVVDQIKNALCYAKLPVILIAADAGYDEANAGAPHIALEDIGVIKALAGIDLYIPSTFYGLTYSFEQAIKAENPVYIRINKDKIEENLCQIQNITDGCYYIRKKEKASLMYMVNGCNVMKAINQKEGDIIAIDDLQCDWTSVIETIKKYSRIVVWEEQFADNGIYSILCRLFVENHIVDKDIKRIGPSKEYKRYCFDRNSSNKEEWDMFKAKGGLM